VLSFLPASQLSEPGCCHGDAEGSVRLQVSPIVSLVSPSVNRQHAAGVCGEVVASLAATCGRWSTTVTCDSSTSHDKLLAAVQAVLSGSGWLHLQSVHKLMPVVLSQLGQSLYAIQQSWMHGNQVTADSFL
jgi:hypothetical protein